MVKKYKIIKNIIFDIIIIGAGITGCYLSNRLSNEFPNKKILIIEKNNRIGGRISSHISKSGVIIEYGAMRIFKEYHPRITKLINDLNIEMIETQYISKKNIFHCKNNIYYNENIFPQTDKEYFLKDFEKNQNLLETVNNNTLNIYKSNGFSNNYYEYNNRYKLYSNKIICSFGYKYSIKNSTNKISNDNWKRFLDITGYSNLFNQKCTFICGSLHNLYFTTHCTQYMVKQGYSQIPLKLIKKHNIYVLKNTELITFELLSSGNSSLIIKNNKTNNIQKIITKELFLCIPKININEINGFNCNFLSKYSKSISGTKSIKIFLHFDEKDNFWNKLGFVSGRCTTTLEIGQFWFYDKNILLTFAIQDNAIYWASIIPYDEQLEPIDINTSNQIRNIVNTQINQYQEIFNSFDITIPLPKKISWMYWEETFCNWDKIYLTPEIISINDTRELLIYPFGKNNKIYYINNDISLFQGWCEGCIEIVDELLHNLYNMPNYLNV